MSDEPTSVDVIRQRLEVERRARGLRAAASAALWIALPTLLAALYFGVLAAPQYSSVAVLTVHRAGQADAQSDALMLRDVVLSPSTLAMLETKTAFSAHYAEVGDWFVRIAADAGSEDRLANYRSRVVPYVDERAGSVSVTVVSFDPDKAYEVVQAIVANAEQMVVEREGKRRKEALVNAEAEVNRARQAMHDFPPATTDASTLERDVAEEGYRLAVRRLAEVRLRPGAMVEVVAPPVKPDQASGPLRLRGIASVGLFALCFYVIATLLIASVRDHARV